MAAVTECISDWRRRTGGRGSSGRERRTFVSMFSRQSLFDVVTRVAGNTAGTAGTFIFICFQIYVAASVKIIDCSCFTSFIRLSSGVRTQEASAAQRHQSANAICRRRPLWASTHVSMSNPLTLSSSVGHRRAHTHTHLCDLPEVSS